MARGAPHAGHAEGPKRQQVRRPLPPLPPLPHEVVARAGPYPVKHVKRPSSGIASPPHPTGRWAWWRPWTPTRTMSRPKKISMQKTGQSSNAAIARGRPPGGAGDDT
ncbi:hypothetical protein GCM10009678_52430 [Actinomadura kijaniata]